jgi:hypothetical protein
VNIYSSLGTFGPSYNRNNVQESLLVREPHSTLPAPVIRSSSYHLQALRVPLVARLAGPRGAARRPRPTLTTTLSPHGRAIARLRARVRGLSGRGRRGGGKARGRRGIPAARGELAADELQRLLTVLGAVLLVQVGVVARAAVRVGAVAVVLDLGG